MSFNRKATDTITACCQFQQGDTYGDQPAWWDWVALGNH